LTVISLETSSELPSAKMGAGPIVRVGDRTSVFDPAVTAELLEAAEQAGITVQRCLMSGGTCEATAFQLYGVRAGALCVALGNYHNRGADLRIEQEVVSVADFAGLTALCVALARGETAGGNAISRLRERLERNLHHYASW
jgi:putative aminopeptidase FrvX